MTRSHKSKNSGINLGDLAPAPAPAQQEELNCGCIGTEWTTGSETRDKRDETARVKVRPPLAAAPLAQEDDIHACDAMENPNAE